MFARLRKPVKGAFDNRRAAENAGESARGEATKNVATVTVCGRVGADPMQPNSASLRKTMRKPDTKPGQSNRAFGSGPLCAVSELSAPLR